MDASNLLAGMDWTNSNSENPKSSFDNSAWDEIFGTLNPNISSQAELSAVADLLSNAETNANGRREDTTENDTNTFLDSLGWEETSVNTLGWEETSVNYEEL